MNLICGVNVSMAEAQEMEGMALVGKIRGRNHSQGKMEEWFRNNWMGFQGEDPEITPFTKGWFSFCFSHREDTDFILKKFWTYGKTPFQLKRWSSLFDVDTERLDTIPVWV